MAAWFIIQYFGKYVKRFEYIYIYIYIYIYLSIYIYIYISVEKWNSRVRRIVEAVQSRDLVITISTAYAFAMVTFQNFKKLYFETQRLTRWNVASLRKLVLFISKLCRSQICLYLIRFHRATNCLCNAWFHYIRNNVWNGDKMLWNKVCKFTFYKELS